MRSWSGAVALALFLIGPGASAAATVPKDVPADHWARNDVEAVLKQGVMSAPGGKFGGSAVVTRTDLIHTMAAFGKSLEKGAWKAGSGKRFKYPVRDRPAPSVSQNLTRYELAAVVSRMGAYAAAGLPKAGPKRFGTAGSLPRAMEVTSVKKTDPAYASVQYLAKNRMIRPDSVLSKPGSEPVTGKDAADAVAAVVTAIIDLRTDEPENREEIGPPPSQDRPAPRGSGKA
jgi:hypothetical protein